MSTKISVNLPVQDLTASTAFFTTLGFAISPQFASETNMECLVISDDIYVLLLEEARFHATTKKAIVDATTHAEIILQLRVESRQRVDELVDKALATGAVPHNEPNDQGFLYGRSFQDLDRHLWDVFYIDPAALRGQA